jgi:hypothetical protein
MTKLSGTDLYLRLLDLQQQFNTSAGQISCAVKRDPVRVYEIKDIIEDPAWKRKPMRSWNVGHCSIQINKELEKYEILQHSRRISRKRKRSASIDFGSEASSSAEVELTSDDDSPEQQKRRQYKVVRQVEEQMRAGIEKNREKWGKPDVHEGILKMHEPRLRKIG